ncbi:MAG: flagellar biosynthesis protein FlhF [Chthonomonadales bacterium]|nr:flagellar biosynthesis protein FlhF [Chthonomonadales bacterium]
MRIKEFQALTLRECLRQVRDEMGLDAVILETKSLRAGGVLGVGSRDVVRIVAATGVTVDEPPRASSPPRPMAAPRAAAVPDDPSARALVLQAAAEAIASRAAGQRPAEPPVRTDALRPEPAARDGDRLALLHREVAELKAGIARIQSAAIGAPDAPAWPELVARLVEADVDEPAAREIVGSLPDLSAWNPPARAAMAEAALRDLLSARVAVSGPIEVTPGVSRVVALVGPTGVGKTTTLAKVAARYALVERRKVALLTVDTYRIAAVEQLRTYGQIMGVPVRVAHSLEEARRAVADLADHDLVLVDTAGRSQRNSTQVVELKALVEALGCETHLALAASTRPRDLREQIARFREVGVSRLLWTKLDEASSYGTIYTLAVESALLISYLTTGQKVPEDIEVADPRRLAELLLAPPSAAAA